MTITTNNETRQHALHDSSGAQGGIAERAFELAVEALRAKTSIALDGRTLAHKPMLRPQMADMWIAIDGARDSLDMIATDWGDGVECDQEWELRITGSKQCPSDLVRFVVDTAMDVASDSSIRIDGELSQLSRYSHAVAHHPAAAAIAHEGIGKAMLSIDLDGPRW